MKTRISDKGRFKRNRGQGTFEKYVPWIWVTDFSSIGLRVRVYGTKIKRLFHLLSLLETRVFYILESMEEVLDIREQFPLFPLSETVEIAQSNNIKHPKFHGAYIVRSSDFYVVTKKKVIVISVKYKDDLQDRRVRELLEIERQYWEKRSIEFRIVTEEDVTWNAFRNAERIRSFSQRPAASITDEAFLEKLKAYRTTASLETQIVLRNIADEASESFATIHHLFLHLVFHKHIQFDYCIAPAIKTKIGDLWI